MKHVILCIALVFSAKIGAQIDFKAKNFPGKKAEFNIALKHLREGTRMLNLAEKGNDSLYRYALDKFLLAQDFNPDHIACNRNIITCLVRMGSFSQTLSYYEKLEKIDPDFSKIYLPAYAEALWKNSKFESGFAMYKKYIQQNGSLEAEWEGMPLDVEKRMDEMQTFLNEMHNPVSREKSFFLKSEKSIPENAVTAMDPFTEDLYYAFYDQDHFRIVRLDKKSNYSLKIAIGKPLKNVSNIKFMSLHPSGKSLVMSDGNDLFILDSFDRDSVRYLPESVNSSSQETAAVFYKNGLIFSSNRNGFTRLYNYDFVTGSIEPYMDKSLPNYCHLHIAAYDQVLDRLVYIRDGKGSIGGSDIYYFEQGKEHNSGNKINSFDNESWVAFTSTGAFFTSRSDSILRFVRRKENLFKPVYVSGAHLLSFSNKTFYASIPVGAKTSVNENFVLVGETQDRIPENQSYFIRITSEDGLQNPPYLFVDSIQGQFRAILPKKGYYLVWIHATGYQPYVKRIDAEAVYTGSEILNFSLKPISNGSRFILPSISANRELTSKELEQSVELNYLHSWLKSNSKVRIRVEVHTDSLNMTPNAIKFGEEKAIGIYNHLRSRDIEKRRLDWIFEGPTSPLFPNSSTQNRSLNRRTEIIIQSR